MNEQNKNAVKTAWIRIDVSTPIVVFVALPIVFLTFCSINGFKCDFITITLISLTSLIVLIFLYMVLFVPENLTIDGRGHLTIKRDEAKRKTGGQSN